MSAILDPQPRTKLSRIIRSRDKMVARIGEIEQRLATLPAREADARVQALRRSPENPVVEDELALALIHERAELESELAELAGNLKAADVVLQEEQAKLEATLRTDAERDALAFHVEERKLWDDAARAWGQLTSAYLRLTEHQLKVAATRPNAYLTSDFDGFVVSPTPVTLAAFVSMLAAASNPSEYEARHVDSAGVLRALVKAFRDPRPELSGEFSVRRQPVQNR